LPAVSALAAFRSLSLNEKRRQVAALQGLPPFQVKRLIAFSFNLHRLQLSILDQVIISITKLPDSSVDLEISFETCPGINISQY
jgi:hypothetical protein